MSLIWSDGFDEYKTLSDLAANYTVGTFGADYLANGGRFGGGCFNSGNYGSGLTRIIAGNPTSLVTGIAVLPAINNYNSTHAFFTIIGNNGAAADVTYDYTRGVFEAHVLSDESLPTVIGQGTAFVQLTGWHFIEIEAYIYVTGNDTIGYHQHATVSVWLDDVQIINAADGFCPTLNPSAAIVAVTLGSGGSGSNPPFNGYFDDWYIHSSTRYGDMRVQTNLPISDAGPNDGTPSISGPHYAMIDSAEFMTSNYITLTDTAGQEELFGIANLTGSPVTILAVQTSVFAVSDGDDAVTLAAVISSAGVEADGSNTAVGSSNSYVICIQEVDPNTSAAWDAAGVNASLAGVKVSA